MGLEEELVPEDKPRSREGVSMGVNSEVPRTSARNSGKSQSGHVQAIRSATASIFFKNYPKINKK